MLHGSNLIDAGGAYELSDAQFCGTGYRVFGIGVYRKSAQILYIFVK